VAHNAYHNSRTISFIPWQRRSANARRDQSFPDYFGNRFNGSCVKSGKLGTLAASGSAASGSDFAFDKANRKRARQGPLKAPSFPCRAQALAAIVFSIRQIARRELPKHRPHSASVKLFLAPHVRGAAVSSSQSVQRVPVASAAPDGNEKCDCNADRVLTKDAKSDERGGNGIG
jgi:hypothetical protein